MIKIDDIKAMAYTLGACNKVESINSIADAVGLLLTPQGREFALKTGFPSIELWRTTANHILLPDCVFLDEDKRGVDESDVVIVGESSVSIVADKPIKLYHIIAMHGAEVEINASNYAVVTVTSINATVRITNDGTAKVTVEQSGKGGSQ
ncbi:MAG: hypothetical protein HDS07_00420 [Bacteroides sp.]|nr:hypothetical protein [Bacteroides sp.]